MNPTDPPKRGRPLGSKTRPKWLRELEKQQPKRSRGRPKGSLNKPKTLAAWLQSAVDITLPPKPSPRPKNQSKVRRENNALNRLTPEERSERARKAALSRKTHGARALGTPPTWATHEYAPLLKEAEREAKRIYTIMDNEGVLPEDPLAREALLEVLKLMRLPGDRKFKHSLARTILEYRLSKPTTKQDVTVRTAEDWLDELAAKEGDEPTSD
jgi:hypothetical protein